MFNSSTIDTIEPEPSGEGISSPAWLIRNATYCSATIELNPVGAHRVPRPEDFRAKANDLGMPDPVVSPHPVFSESQQGSNFEI
jgi:hypothetical protein